jgi:hypothetical protein
MDKLTKYTDKDGNVYTLQPYQYNKGDDACVGCTFKFGNSKACIAAPTCTPNNTSDIRNGRQNLPFPEWIGEHLVWR